MALVLTPRACCPTAATTTVTATVITTVALIVETIVEMTVNALTVTVRTVIVRTVTVSAPATFRAYLLPITTKGAPLCLRRWLQVLRFRIRQVDMRRRLPPRSPTHTRQSHSLLISASILSCAQATARLPWETHLLLQLPSLRRCLRHILTLKRLFLPAFVLTAITISP